MKHFRLKIILFSSLALFMFLWMRIFGVYGQILSENVLHAYFLEAGQGDMTLLRWRNTTAVIDGGEENSVTADRALRYMKKLGIKEIDFLVLSHAHADHLYGLLRILENLKVRQVFLPVFPHTSELYKSFCTLLRNKNIPCQTMTRGLHFEFSEGPRFQVLSPPSPSPFQDIDNNSSVLKVQYQNFKMLFTGDIFFEAEKFLVETYGDQLKTDVLKIPHHGSKTSSSQFFLKKTAPEVAVIFCKKGNKYGFPHGTALRRIERWAKRVWRTDKEGGLHLRVREGVMNLSSL